MSEYNPDVVAFLRKKGILKSPLPPVPDAHLDPAQAQPQGLPEVTPPAAQPVAAPAAAAPSSGPDWRQALGIAFSGIGDAYAASVGKPTTNAEDMLKTIQEAPMKKLALAKAQREATDLAEKDDPNSETSKVYQQIAAKYTGRDPKTMTRISASKLEKVLPTIEKFASTELTRKSAENVASENRLAHQETARAGQDAKNLTLAEKEDQRRQNRFKQLGEALDPSKQARGAFSVSKQVFDRAERLESLASALPNGNLDSRQIEELAIGLNSMLSGSNTGAQRQVENLVPRSVYGNVQKLKEFLTNNPTGLHQQAFVKRMLGSIAREKATAEDQMNRTRFSRIAPYTDLENDPLFHDVLQSNGVDPEKYKSWKAGGYKSISAVQQPDGGDLGAKSPKPGGVLHQDAQGNKAWVYPDGTFDEVK